MPEEGEKCGRASSNIWDSPPQLFIIGLNQGCQYQEAHSVVASLKELMFGLAMKAATRELKIATTKPDLSV